MNPILESTQNPCLHPQEEIGYKISQTDQAVKKALFRALEILKKMRWTGAETRMWSAHVEIDTKQKMDGIKYPEMGQKLKGLFLVEKKIREITDWENDILQTVRRYMTESNDLINQVKTLNPPLTSEHLKPFIEAMQKDRSATITTLNPITSNIDELSALKLSLRQGRFPILSYSPVP